MERLNRLAVRDVLALVIGDDACALPIAKTQDQCRTHPARMSDEVAQWLIQYGSPPGGVCGDNFCGSGTSLILAKALGRHHYGSDLCADYVAQAEAALAAIEFGSLQDPEGTVPPAASAPRGPRQPRSPQPATATCACGKAFAKRTRWQQFCSDRCRFQFHNDRRRKS
jgi:hypothetical protein